MKILTEKYILEKENIKKETCIKIISVICYPRDRHHEREKLKTNQNGIRIANGDKVTPSAAAMIKDYCNHGVFIIISFFFFITAWEIRLENKIEKSRKWEEKRLRLELKKNK